MFTCVASNEEASCGSDTVKAYVSELVRANQTKTNIEFRLRQLDAARVSFINLLQSEVEDSGISPTEDDS